MSDIVNINTKSIYLTFILFGVLAFQNYLFTKYKIRTFESFLTTLFLYIYTYMAISFQLHQIQVNIELDKVTVVLIGT